jgi:hypothetical protein
MGGYINSYSKFQIGIIGNLKYGIWNLEPGI